MESNNTFEQMNSDVSKIYQSNKQYIKAENYRPITNIGGSNGSLVNVKGNNCELTFPPLKNIYKLVINRTLSNDGVITLTINGQTTNPITINQTTTTSDIVNYIKNLPNCYTGTYSSISTFAVSYNSSAIYIYQQPEYSTCSISNVQDITITIVSISGLASMSFIDTLGETFGSQQPFISEVLNDPIVILGSTYIGEIFYLFTSTQINSQGLGQIWELQYDEISKTTSLKLLYNNTLNFSLNFPIAPSACIGRYELPTIQRIYWTDNNNPVRSINVKDANTMALDTDLLDLTPSIQMSIATLKLITDSGAVHNLTSDSTYQCAYRLVKSNGSITNYSITSNIVNPIAQPTSRFVGSDPSYASLNGDVVTVNKTITWEVNNIDTSYDTIEFVIITRQVPFADNFIINKYETQLINGQSTITTTFTNDTDNFELISSDEFLIENTAFTHCKTLEQKDNRLFFADVRNGLSDFLELFDTRTFRFSPSSNNIIIKNTETDTSTNTVTIIGNNYSILSESADLIPAYNLGMEISDDPLYNGNCKYQRNSTIIGGEGPNIKYAFGSLLLCSDETPTTPAQSVFGSSLEGSTRDNGSSSQVYKNGYRKAGVITNITSPLIPYYSNLAPQQNYYTNLAKSTMGIEYFNGNFRGYELNEIYRFGIRFYYKNGNGYFVKWIGDIKFPNYNDSVAPGLEGIADDGSFCSDFRSMYSSGGKVYSNIPYIQFNVNISNTLSSLISHYEIVRVERKDSDMSITGHGIVNQIARTGKIPTSPFFSTPETIGFMNPDNGSLSTSATSAAFTFHSFKHIIDESASLITTNDKIIVTEKYNNNLNTAVWPLNSVPTGTFSEHWYIRKFYELNDFIYNNSFNASFKINSAIFAASSPDTGPGYTLVGLSADSVGSSNSFFNRSNGGSSTCSNCVAISTTDNFQWSYFGSDLIEDPSGITPGGTSKLLAIHFKPLTLRTQYKGRTSISRAQNEYISCGALYNVTIAGNTKINVFGGDIFYGILDIHKEIKEFEPTSGVPSHSQSWFFPTHSRYNIDLRSGSHTNSDLNDDGGINDLYSEEFVSNKANSYENTLYKYFPKPFDFNNTSSFSNRVYWSSVKFNGETSDSWTTIPILNFYDVDGNYGGITSLITLRNDMYFLQESAFGILLINQQSLMPDQNDTTLKVGVGDTLNKHLYNSVDIGSKHQWSISKSNEAITFCDIRHNKLYLFDGQQLNPVSDIKGLRGFLNKTLHDDILVNDNPILNKGILTTYDFSNNEFLYTFLNTFVDGRANITENYTVAYSDLTGGFSSFYSFTPYIYLNNHNKLYSTDIYSSTQSSKLYLHNIGNYGTFYGTTYPSKLKVNINEGGITTKVFDNLSWITESIDDALVSTDDINDEREDSDNINYLNDTITRLRCYTEYQNTDWTSLSDTPISGNIRKSEQGWNIQVPRSKVNLDSNNINQFSIFDPAILTKTLFGDRLRDKYMIVDLEYDNSLNNRFIIHNLKSTFRTSDR